MIENIKKHQKDSHFIPSPLPAVTQYENDFVRRWNENMSKAMGEVLKYIANQTAQVIKDKEKLKTLL
jgi:hypothetical protein